VFPIFFALLIVGHAILRAELIAAVVPRKDNS